MLDWKLDYVKYGCINGFVCVVSVRGLETGLERWKLMDYKISNICTGLGIGKSTVYKRIDILKQSIPETDWKNNEYFYYTDNNRLFFTEKGFAYIRDFKINADNIRQSPISDITVYQNQIIEMYKKENEYLKQENQRLLDIISLKEQKELAKDIKEISPVDNNNFFSRIASKFKKR